MKSEGCGAYSNGVKGAIQKCLIIFIIFIVFIICFRRLIHIPNNKIMKTIEYENDKNNEK
jgi:hypothetical protein